MAILKSALLSLAILTQGMNAKAEEAKPQITLEQILKSSEEAAKKIAAEPVKNQQKQESSEWKLLDQELSMSNALQYTLPKGFRLDLDGHIRGKGFRWKINDKEFYYKDTGILGYLDSFNNISYEDSILISDKKLGELIDSYNNEEDYLLDELEGGIATLEKETIEKYKDKYSQEFMQDMFWYLLEILPNYGKADGELTVDEYPQLFDNLNEFLKKFYNKEIDKKDQKSIEKSLSVFLEKLDYLLENTETGKTTNMTMADPWNNTYIGKEPLGHIKDLAEDFGEFFNLRISKDSVTANLDLEASGKVASEWSETQKLKRGDKTLDFNHVVHYNQRIRAHGFLGLELKFDNGRPLYLYVTDDDRLKLQSMEEMAGLKINIPNMKLNARAGYEYNSRSINSESFQLSEQTKTGSKGVGSILSLERGEYTDALVSAKGQLNTYDWYAKALVLIEQNMSKARYMKDLIYAFNEGKQGKFWHYNMLGAEYYDNEGYALRITHKYDYLVNFGEKAEAKKQSRYYGDKEDDQGIRPCFNTALGVANSIVNPFFTYKMTPNQTLKMGAMLDLPHITSRFALKTMTDNMQLYKDKMFIGDSMMAETSFTMFDSEGNKKTMSYYIRTEQEEATPKIGNINDQRNAMMKLYSDLDGLLIMARIVNQDYTLRSVWGSSDKLFIGTGYISNLENKTRAGELTAGYERFSVTGAYGTATQDKNYSRTFTLSAAGTISEKSVYLDLHSALGPFSADNYYFYEDEFRAVLNVSGPFDEIEPLKKITQDAKAAIEKQKKAKK